MVTNGWEEYKKLVMQNQERQERLIEKLQGLVNDLATELAILKTEFRARAGIWGLIGGAIPVVVMIGIYMLAKS